MDRSDTFWPLCSLLIPFKRAACFSAQSLAHLTQTAQGSQVASLSLSLWSVEAVRFPCLWATFQLHLPTSHVDSASDQKTHMQMRTHWREGEAGNESESRSECQRT